MNRAFSLILFAALLTAFVACGSGKVDETPAAEKAGVAAEPGKVVTPPPAEPATQPTAGAEPQKAGAEDGAAAGEAEAPAEGAEDPDDEAWGGDGTAVDRDKLAKAYEEVYCAQKKNEMEKILDIYKNYGFEKPEDFIAMWMEAARDTGWVTKVAHDATSKCK